MSEDIQEDKKRDYVSFSELHLFSQCPWKHHVRYVLKQKDPHTIFSAFGTAIHRAIEHKWKLKISNSWISMCKIIILFCQFHNEDYKPWIKSSLRIFKDFFPWIEENFPDCELYDIEFKLEEPIPGFDRKFLGYIDLILYDRQKDQYHILDLKTTSWGWGQKQLSDTKKLYQAILYKKYFCEKMSIDPKKVECHYLLLLRNPAKKEKYALKLHSVTSGQKKMDNAGAWVIETAEQIKLGVRLKMPATCSFCTCEYKNRKRK